MKTFVAVPMLLLSGIAAAQNAPFCAVFSYGTQCHYYSADACRQAAGTQGMCVVNSQREQPSQQRFSPMESMMQGQEMAEKGAKAGTERRFNRLAGEAMNAKTPDERKTLIAQAVATDPERGMKLAEFLESRDLQQSPQRFILYRCKTPEGVDAYTATPAIGCVVASLGDP